MQEYIEIRRDDTTVIIEDFVRVRSLVAGKSRSIRYRIRDKGHLKMYRAFRKAVTENSSAIYSNNDLVRTSNICFEIIDQLG